MRPDAGQVRTRGRISGLIATGAGFHPQLTGRENIYLNAAILGMTQGRDATRSSTTSSSSPTSASSSTPRSATTPRACSPGSASRSPSTSTADVFLADEVLAVGDQPFKRKCMEKMQEIRDSGVTLFYVSHAAAVGAQDVRPGARPREGPVGFDGDVDEGIKLPPLRRRRRGRPRAARRRGVDGRGDGRRHLSARRHRRSSRRRRSSPSRPVRGSSWSRPVRRSSLSRPVRRSSLSRPSSVEPVETRSSVEPVETIVGRAGRDHVVRAATSHPDFETRRSFPHSVRVRAAAPQSLARAVFGASSEN